MLKKVESQAVPMSGGRFAIVASRYNAEYVDSMIRGAEQVLAQAPEAELRIYRVPGAYEIPLIAGQLARRNPRQFDAIICLGVIIRGETEHAQLIGEAVTQALMRIQLQTLMPVVHEVLLLENRTQADVRCLDPQHNRGIEAAQTAVAMAALVRQIKYE